MKLTIEVDREEDGRYFAVVQELPGVITYGKSEDDAVKNAVSLALRVLADKIEHGESVPVEASKAVFIPFNISFAAA